MTASSAEISEFDLVVRAGTVATEVMSPAPTSSSSAAATTSRISRVSSVGRFMNRWQRYRRFRSSSRGRSFGTFTAERRETTEARDTFFSRPLIPRVRLRGGVTGVSVATGCAPSFSGASNTPH